MSEIPVYPDECEHGNAHIEGVNECAVCQCDATTRALEASRLEINRIQLERMRRGQRSPPFAHAWSSGTGAACSATRRRASTRAPSMRCDAWRRHGVR
jgi:hypothetical protein